ncbi:MAG TPA: hypothetical protein P5119_11185 [Candidatus Aminicenantes bacterium]|nr:hypothetical protein [Candidatus Aminicenantes bacterium]HRY65888.1 hypothetical protein [Candidatus Aminicenantes bacterium]HRZ72786.1 hypothetical protein [Candidatus Aminicenantes bacterium]
MSPKLIARPALALLLAALVFSAPVFGQTRRHDLSVSYGALSIDQMSDILQDVLTVVLTFGTFNKTDTKYTGVPFLTYHYSGNSRFGFGVAVGTYKSSGTLQAGGEDAGTFEEQNTIGAVELDYRWVMRPGLQIYSGAGFGVRYRHGTYETDGSSEVNKFLPTFHINAIGVRFGRKVGAFFELGAGYKGVLSAGLNAQF